MARKKSTASASPKQPTSNLPYYLPTDAEWGGFINIRLSEEQVAEFWHWYTENADGWTQWLPDLLSVGLKITFSFDPQNNCHICSVTGALVSEAPDARFCSNSRSAALTEVIALTYWKHAVLARGDYGRYRPKDGLFLSFG